PRHRPRGGEGGRPPPPPPPGRGPGRPPGPRAVPRPCPVPPGPPAPPYSLNLKYIPAPPASIAVAIIASGGHHAQARRSGSRLHGEGPHGAHGTALGLPG